MSETAEATPRTDDQGVEIDQSAHIPEGTEEVLDTKLDPEDRDMSAVTDEPGLHPTSLTFGTVVSDHATDAAGNTPEDIAAQTTEERSSKKSSKSSKKSKK